MTRPRPPALLALLTALLLALAACSSDPPGPQDTAKGRDKGCDAPFSSDRDYFPDKSTVRHAKNFTIRYEKSYQVLTVKEPYPKGRPESYVLVRCGAPSPELTGDLAGAQRITVPVKSLYSGSTTQLSLLTASGSLGALTGVASTKYVVSADVRKRIAAGKVAEYAPNGTVNTEKVIAARPDAVMTAGMDDPQFAKLRRAGIGVVANAEWLEPTPLGRAEWVKAVAALTGAEKRAGEVFREVEQDYRRVAATAAKAAPPTPVLLGTLLQGSWTLAAGGSYFGQLVTTAGGSYPWQGDRSTGSLRLSFETVYAKAGSARTWLVDQTWKSTADAVRADPRHARLTAVSSGEVWSNTKSLGPDGGNDFYESGVLRPDLVLADLVAVLHPDLAPGHRFTYYERVPRT
ncbi:ABC transporter substrate-binding protein [Streptomyces sp. NPDC021093]|uniref:ABC transporter substrate-binding protein n=1 Tax=Streptomyces sp. NPDC021093 TaxID=3365112 RepID=UPI0037A3D16E